jgi:hypothetical protein
MAPKRRPLIRSQRGNDRPIESNQIDAAVEE